MAPKRPGRPNGRQVSHTQSSGRSRRFLDFFRLRKPTPQAAPTKPSLRDFPALHSFITREADFFPELPGLVIKPSFHQNGVPKITGNERHDTLLLGHCNEIALLSEKVTGLFRGESFPGYNQAENAINEAGKLEVQISTHKKYARRTLFSMLAKGKMKVLLKYPRGISAINALRLFLKEESAHFPALQQRAGGIVKNPQESMHSGTSVPIITGNLGRDRRLSQKCRQVFILRDSIRKEMQNAADLIWKNNVPKARASLTKADHLEKMIDGYKAELRKAVVLAFVFRGKKS